MGALVAQLAELNSYWQLLLAAVSDSSYDMLLPTDYQ